MQKIIKNGVTYYMTEKEARHAEEYIAMLEQEIAEREKSWEAKKKAFDAKYGSEVH